MRVKQEYRQLKNEEIYDTEVKIWMMPDPETDTQFYKAEWENGEYEGRRTDKRDLIMFLRRLETKSDQQGILPQGEFSDEDDMVLGDILMQAEMEQMSLEEARNEVNVAKKERQVLKSTIDKVERFDFSKAEKEKLLPTLELELQGLKERIEALQDFIDKNGEK